jgi:hypothetical protein
MTKNKHSRFVVRFPLAKALLNNGFSVKGSTTSTDKIVVLENAGIQAFQVVLDSESVAGPIQELLKALSYY